MHMGNLRHAALPLVLAPTLVLAGCAAPAEPLPPAATRDPLASEPLDPGSPAGGGRVLNAAPRVLAFRGSLERADNGGGSMERFEAALADDNAEADLASLNLAASGPQRFSLVRTLTRDDLGQRAEPAPGLDGFAVWDATPQDGILHLAVRFTYPYGAAPGLYTWVLVVRDLAGSAAASGEDATLVEPLHVVAVEGAVHADGTPAPAEGWGGWSAPPGAEGVRSRTFLKVVNGGTAAPQDFLVDFTSRAFVGAEDPQWRVPLDGNVRFGSWEAEPGQAPQDGEFAWGDASPDGSVTLRFTRPGSVVYVAYEVLRVPSPLPAQLYHASATVTAL